MAETTAIRRTFFMHPAHRTVGVSGIGSSFTSLPHPGDQVEDWSAGETKVRPRHVSLVCRTENSRQAAILFERMLLERGSVVCQHVSNAVAVQNGIADTDCIAIFGPGLQIVERQPMLSNNYTQSKTGTEVKVVGVAVQHPILDGIAPFHSFCYPAQIAQPADNVVCLLIGETPREVFPLAWVREGHDRGFCTLLGRAEDYRRPEFVRLLLNAVDWIMD
jgi:hypothetical protein